MDNIYTGVTTRDLDGLELSKPISFTLSYSQLKTARQLVYNRQNKYIGCEIDTSQAPKASNIEGHYNLIIVRRSYGRATNGEWEPGTTQRFIKEQQLKQQ